MAPSIRYSTHNILSPLLSFSILPSLLLLRRYNSTALACGLSNSQLLVCCSSLNLFCLSLYASIVYTPVVLISSTSLLFLYVSTQLLFLASHSHTLILLVRLLSTYILLCLLSLALTSLYLSSPFRYLRTLIYNFSN